jgi:hypothetical protein
MDLQNKIHGSKLLLMRTRIVLRKNTLTWWSFTALYLSLSLRFTISSCFFFFRVWTPYISGLDHQEQPNSRSWPFNLDASFCLFVNYSSKVKDMGKRERVITLSFPLPGVRRWIVLRVISDKNRKFHVVT